MEEPEETAQKRAKRKGKRGKAGKSKEFHETEKLLLFHYHNVIHPIPNIYVVNLLKDTLNEVIYDKETSQTSSYQKRAIYFDKAAGYILAFSHLSYESFDYIDLGSLPLVWHRSRFE